MVVCWKTAKREDIPLGAMSLSHITGCIWGLEKDCLWLDGCNGFSNKEWLMIFRAELTRRSRFA